MLPRLEVFKAASCTCTRLEEAEPSARGNLGGYQLLPRLEVFKIASRICPRLAGSPVGSGRAVGRLSTHGWFPPLLVFSFVSFSSLFSVCGSGREVVSLLRFPLFCCIVVLVLRLLFYSNVSDLDFIASVVSALMGLEVIFLLWRFVRQLLLQCCCYGEAHLSGC